jgi:hypothetical protein
MAKITSMQAQNRLLYANIHLRLRRDADIPKKCFIENDKKFSSEININ